MAGRIARDATWRRAVAQLRALALPGGLDEGDGPPPPPLWKQRPAEAIAAGDFLPAATEEVDEHLRQSRGACHPRAVQPVGLAAAEPSLRAAVRQLHLWRDATQARRKRRLLKLQQLESSLLPLSDELRRDFSPAHMREDGAPRLHSAWLACIARAFNLDARIGVDAVLRFTPVGRVPASGAFPPLIPEVRGRAAPSAQRFAQFEFDELDHADAELERSVRDGGGRQAQSEQKQEGMQVCGTPRSRRSIKAPCRGPSRLAIWIEPMERANGAPYDDASPYGKRRSSALATIAPNPGTMPLLCFFHGGTPPMRFGRFSRRGGVPVRGARASHVGPPPFLKRRP